jgi:hypothetical protein
MKASAGNAFLRSSRDVIGWVDAKALKIPPKGGSYKNMKAFFLLLG